MLVVGKVHLVAPADVCLPQETEWQRNSSDQKGFPFSPLIGQRATKPESHWSGEREDEATEVGWGNRLWRLAGRRPGWPRSIIKWDADAFSRYLINHR